MKKIKRNLTVIALLAIILTFLSQTSVAYFTTVGAATNVVTSGNIRFLIHETTDQGTEFPREGVYIFPAT